MAQITLDIPNTLHHQLEGLAQYEGVQLPQYILYILMQQARAAYTVHQHSEEDVMQQRADYMTLRQQWGIASPAQVSEVLAEREKVEPEPGLKPETILKLRQRIEEKRKVTAIS